MTSRPSSDRPIGRFAALAWGWSAGGAFVASMAYFAYFYLLGLSRTPAGQPAPPADAVAVNVLLFALFAAHHSVMARVGAKRWIARLVSPSLERATYVWVASLLFFAVCGGWQHVPGRFYQFSGGLAVPFWLVQAAGIFFILYSARTVNVFDLAGIEQVTRPDEPPHEAPAAHEMGRLETTGPYRVVRHPIYLGTVVLLAATPDLTFDRLLFSILSLVYLVVGIAFEERSLRDEFGEAYAAYARTVRWRLLPGVY